MTGNCGFDLSGRVFVNVETMPTKHREQSAACLCQDDERASVEAMKWSLESNCRRSPFSEKRLELRGQVNDAVGHRQFRGTGDLPVRNGG